ncbi:MAG: glycosyltransferase [Paracoccaceae bacterium]|nr:glycosyltransferase [Paracoccaceae bacterium]
MIFVTVGTQLPFERLTAAAAAWARGAGEAAVIQSGGAPRGGEAGDALVSWRAHLPPEEFAGLFEAARVVVAHAGIGTILTAQRARKPLVVLPRRAALGEHRNDHQLATARHIEGLTGLYVAWETADLEAILDRTDLAPAAPGTGAGRDRLIARIAGFLSS